MSKDPDKPRALYAMSTSPRHLPPDWNPPAPAWATSFAQQTTPVVMAYFGTQLEAKNEQRIDPQLQEFFASGDAPDNLENAAFIDRAGTGISFRRPTGRIQPITNDGERNRDSKSGGELGYCRTLSLKNGERSSQLNPIAPVFNPPWFLTKSSDYRGSNRKTRRWGHDEEQIWPFQLLEASVLTMDIES